MKANLTANKKRSLNIVHIALAYQYTLPMTRGQVGGGWLPYHGIYCREEGHNKEKHILNFAPFL